MTFFHYIARRENGLPLQGWLMAESRDEALATLKRWRLHPLIVKPGPGRIPVRVPAEELLATLRELASLRGSGMPLDQAVEAVAATAAHGRLARSWRQVGRMLQAGLSLSDAMASSPEAFPRFVPPLVRVGEANGRLKEALQAAADRLEEEMRLSAEVKTALAYPSFLLVISLSVLAFLFLVVVPKFGVMVRDMGNAAPGAIDALVAVSEGMRRYLWLWGSGMLAGLAWLAVEWRAGRLQGRLWGLLRRAPGIRGLVESWEVIQFCGSMHRLLDGGVGVLEALRLSSEILGDQGMRDRLRRASNRVRQGQPLARALEEERLFPKLALQMVAMGEASANLPGALKEVRELYERRMREGIRRYLALLEPAVIVTMGLLVGGIMVTLLSAIMSMNDLPI